MNAPRLTKEKREEILALYLKDAEAGTQLAMSLGLSAAYAYRLANERGVLPVTRWTRKGKAPKQGKVIAQLREARRQMKLSQEALAAKLGMTVNSGSTISRFESETYNPTLARLVEWADALGYELALRPKQ
jgi:DNA-binding XRE family transcriptional regulator